ncbi:pentraxin fusion protein-like [Antedon mediterranea]|uniref:pentraxin fusion protein-like n=1 Tax=Antedon mediterranea TaxID=105859 RepID=UPI003AF6674C
MTSSTRIELLLFILNFFRGILTQDKLNITNDVVTKQSSTYIDQGNKAYVAELAIDGNSEPHVRTCTHSRMEYEPWWMLDLRKTYDIRYVDIVNRYKFEHRLIGAEVGIGMSRKPGVNPRCGTVIDDSMTSVGYELRVDCAWFMHGRFVTIQLVGIREYLTLCEVTLFGYGKIS